MRYLTIALKGNELDPTPKVVTYKIGDHSSLFFREGDVVLKDGWDFTSGVFPYPLLEYILVSEYEPDTIALQDGFEETITDDVAEESSSLPEAPGPPPVIYSAPAPVDPSPVGGTVSGVPSVDVGPGEELTRTETTDIKIKRGHKPGYKTTEFWITGLTIAGAAATGITDIVPPQVAGAVAAIAGIAYTGARGLLKYKAGGAITPPEEESK